MKTRSKILAVLLAVVAAATVGFATIGFSGCGEEDGAGDAQRTDLSGTVNVTGSTSVQEVMGPLADAFMEMYPDVQINITGSGSGTGISDTAGGLNDFGMSSRALKDTEIANGVVGKKIADDGIALVVNSSNSTSDVTTQQVYDLYKNGTAIGTSVTYGIGREASSGTRGAFDELIVSNGEDLTSGYHTSVVEQTSTGNVKTAVAQANNSMGYISLGSVDDTVKAVKFNGVEPTVENVKNGTYKLARPFLLVLNGSDVESAVREMSAEAQAFYYFILSPDGQEIIADAGYISLYL